MFSCEYYEIFKYTYFEEHLRTATSGIITDETLLRETRLYICGQSNEVIDFILKHLWFSIDSESLVGCSVFLVYFESLFYFTWIWLTTLQKL